MQEKEKKNVYTKSNIVEILSSSLWKYKDRFFNSSFTTMSVGNFLHFSKS